MQEIKLLQSAQSPTTARLQTLWGCYGSQLFWGGCENAAVVCLFG